MQYICASVRMIQQREGKVDTLGEEEGTVQMGSLSNGER